MFGRNRISEDVSDWLTGKIDCSVAVGALRSGRRLPDRGKRSKIDLAQEEGARIIV